MATYCVTGQPGAGKTLYAVDVIRRYLVKGLPVATNIDINLPALCKPTSKKTIIRLPDYPSVADFEAIGKGNTTRDENKHGVVLLDEAGIWLNAREWNDKGRDRVIAWMRQSRKLGWHLYLISQAVGDLDKQVRAAIVEHVVYCRRTDRLNVPVIGTLWRAVADKGMLPEVHFGVIKYGTGPNSVVVGRDWYRPGELKEAYDTAYRYVPTELGDNWGISTQLSAWHRHGRYISDPVDPLTRMRRSVAKIKAEALRVRAERRAQLDIGGRVATADILLSPA